MEKANKITAYNIVSTVILQGISAITAPIISRMLGTSNYGIAVIYITWVTIISTVFGLQTKSSLALARKEYPDEEQNNYQSSVLVLSVAAFLVFSVVYLVFIGEISRLLQLEKRLLILILLQGFGVYVISFYNYKNTYEFRAKNNFYLSLCVSLSTTLLSIILIYSFSKEVNYWGRILGMAIPNFFIGVFLFVKIVRNGDIFVNKDYWKFCLAICFPMIVHDLSGILLSQSDRVMLKSICDSSSVGIYSLALNFSAVLSMIWAAFNNSWIPFFYEYLRINDLKTMFKRAINYMELFSVLSIGFTLLSIDVYHVYAGSGFWEGTKLIPLFVFGYYMVFLYSFVVNFEIYCKKTSYIAMITLSAGSINVLLNYLLIPRWGIYGAAIATTISHVLQFVFHYMGAKFFIRETILPFTPTFFIPGTLCVLLACVIFYVFYDFWMIRWGIGIVIGLYELYRIYRRRSIF